MPLIEVTLIAGRKPEQIRTLIDALTTATRGSLECPQESIRVIVREVPATHWAVGGETVAERRGNSPIPQGGRGLIRSPSPSHEAVARSRRAGEAIGHWTSLSKSAQSEHRHPAPPIPAGRASGR